MFDFPASPTTGQQITMPDGTVRVWDGAKWANREYQAIEEGQHRIQPYQPPPQPQE
jgi:hypothetical protein